jgi:hypothetical protein
METITNDKGKNMPEEKKKKRLALTVDFYEEEVFEGIQALALSERKKVSRYLREVLTDHYHKRRGRFK